MTLLKFAVTLLSTMVVAVNLSSEPANSLAFAQQDKDKIFSEEDFQRLVQTLHNELTSLWSEKKVAESDRLSAENQAKENRLLKTKLEKKRIRRSIWKSKGYKNQEELDAKEKETREKFEALVKRRIALMDAAIFLCRDENFYSCDFLEQ